MAQVETKVEFSNPPVQTWVWTDHIRKCKFVQVAAPIFAGSKNVNFVISEDGMSIILNFNWPTPIYRPNELFEHEINAIVQPITSDHPKVHSLTTQLLENGVTEKSNPKCAVKIYLPLKIQREAGSWTKKAIQKVDGSKVVLLEFKGYQESSYIKDVDTNILFD